MAARSMLSARSLSRISRVTPTSWSDEGIYQPLRAVIGYAAESLPYRHFGAPGPVYTQSGFAGTRTHPSQLCVDRITPSVPGARRPPNAGLAAGLVNLGQPSTRRR